jgi:AcrR family transcriptional regulator
MTDSADAVEIKPQPKGDPRGRIVDALLQLAAERRFEEISIRDIAARAGVSLLEFRDAFPSKSAVLGGLNRIIDRAALTDPIEDDSASTRDRLFEALMRRLDAMAPYKAGLREVVAWLKRDPTAAPQMNRAILNSMRFVLETVGVDAEGPAGALKLQGLVFAWIRIVEVWLEDEEEGLSRTLAALDSELTRGEGFVRGLDTIERIAAPFKSLAMSALAAGSRFGRRREAPKPEPEKARDF